MSKNPKVALVYDWLTTPYGGAEKVLLALHQAFPEAPLFTSVYHPNLAPWAQVFDIRTTFLQHIPGATRFYRWLSPLMPLAFESLNLDEFDLIISITSAEAKGILTKPHQLHVSYLLTPTRYLYSHEAEYQSQFLSLPVLGSVIRYGFKYLKWWDQSASARPDKIIPISEQVADRIKKYYAWPPEAVLYPPAEVSAQPTDQKLFKRLAKEHRLPGEYYLVISRLVPYKRIDLVILACQALGRPLVIIGDGPELLRLQALVASASNTEQTILFLKHQPKSIVDTLLAQARGVLMPGVEDFGITALEATAAGKPVIVHAQSGVAEVIPDKTHGVHLQELTVEALISAILQLEESDFSPDQLQQSMTKYDTTSFVKSFKQRILDYWKEWNV